MDISAADVVLGAGNLILGLGIGYMNWSLKRLIDQNDKAHETLDDKAEAAGAAVAAEREARHADRKETTDRIWSVNGDVKENYAPRRETMRQFATVLARIDQFGRDLDAKLDKLPCQGGGITIAPRPACPGANEEVTP